jgi:galactose mutarotase-like enzyme
MSAASDDTVTRIANDRISVEISPLGAEMQSLKTADGRNFLWNGDPAFWAGRSPILFPIVGKAPSDTVVIEGKPYPMAQHGFARRSTFTLAASDETSCRFELASSDTTRSVYPFDFRLAVTHSVDGSKLTISAEVENRSDRPMPFGLGFHTAFLWPLPGGEGKPHTITLDNGAEPLLTRLEDGLVTRDKLPSPFSKGHLTLSHDLFEADAMIFAEGAGKGLTYAAEGGPSLKFAFDNLPNLALWQKVGAPFLCVEPWHGTAAEAGGSAEMAKRPYTTILPAGEKVRFTFSVLVTG